MNSREFLERTLGEFIDNHEAKIWVVVGPKEVQGIAAIIEAGWLVLSVPGGGPHYVRINRISAWGRITH